jgi:hypothetical protein
MSLVREHSIARDVGGVGAEPIHAARRSDTQLIKHLKTRRRILYLTASREWGLVHQKRIHTTIQEP